MITQTVTIPIHSFVDVITNSSSEIFVAADKNTLNAIKKLVNNIISASAFGKNATNAKLPTADDLFAFEIKYKCYDDNYDEVYMSAEEIKAKRKELDEIRDNPDKYSDEQITAIDEWQFNDGDGYVKSAVIVEVKDKANKSAVDAAKVLSNLTALFNIESTYN